MFSVGRNGVARLQVKVGHMDGMHCFTDSTSKYNQSHYIIDGLCINSATCCAASLFQTNRVSADCILYIEFTQMQDGSNVR